MKSVVGWLSASLLLFGIATNLIAQAPPPGPPVLGQVPWPPPPPLPGNPLGGPQSASASANPSIAGTVKQYLLTPVGDVEGLELQDGTDVRFPPHMGAALASIVKPGDRVNVLGSLGHRAGMDAPLRHSRSRMQRPIRP